MNVENLSPGLYWWVRDYGPTEEGEPSYSPDTAHLVYLWYSHPPIGSRLVATFFPSGNKYNVRDLEGQLRGPVSVETRAEDAPVVAEQPARPEGVEYEPRD